MKLLLIALNAKYIHSNLAVHSLKAYCRKVPGIEVAEYTINQPLQKITADIYKRAPDALFFSCYLWNLRQIEELAAVLAKVVPSMDIWLGGPEVSFDAEETLERLPYVKGVMRGEGEETFFQLAKGYASGTFGAHGQEAQDVLLNRIDGLSYRNSRREICHTTERPSLKMDDVPFPYDALGNFENRILYYESSRGCPFRCSYCLSSVDKTLRVRSLARVKRELGLFLEHSVPQVKFIDRTFNCNHRHAMEIWRYLKEKDNGVTNFHFEIAGDLLTEEMVSLLGTMRPGQVQLEIGVQSINQQTLQAIDRSMDVEKLRSVTGAIREQGNIHMHLDLIAGLPYEDFHSFRTSFDAVFAMRPHQLQLGFLKVLKGSPMEARRKEYGLCYMDGPPYEVLETKWLSYGELLRLKAVEEMVESYYNSGQFTRSLEMLSAAFDSPFVLFEALALWHEEAGLDMVNLSRNRRYELLLQFGAAHLEKEAFTDALLYDYYARENAKNRPAFFGEERVEKGFSKAFYSREAREHRYLKDAAYQQISDPRVLRRMTHLEKLGGRYYLFDYNEKDPVSGNVTAMVLGKGASETP